MSLGIPAGTCESTCGKPAKNLDPEGSSPIDPSPGQIQVSPLKKSQKTRRFLIALFALITSYYH